MSTALSLEVIYHKTGLDPHMRNLHKVSALGLPGSPGSKINYVGDALSPFVNLRRLDLSRNELSSLDGLGTLLALEELVLYYNLIGSEDELTKLSRNTKLTLLDLRLNPVTKSDYRQKLIALLPNLETLDDRPVNFAERELASQKLLQSEELTVSVAEYTRCPDPLKTEVSTFSQILANINDLKTDSPSPCGRDDVKLCKSFTPEDSAADIELQYSTTSNGRIGFLDTQTGDIELVSSIVTIICDILQEELSESQMTQIRESVSSLVENLHVNFPEDNEKASVVAEIKSLKHQNSDLKRKLEKTTRLSRQFAELQDALAIADGRKPDIKTQDACLSPVFESVSLPNMEELYSLRRRVKMYEDQLSCLKHVDSLAHMLQSSHEALVRANAQLVEEIGVIRKRHQEEITELTVQLERLQASNCSADSNESDGSEL